MNSLIRLFSICLGFASMASGQAVQKVIDPLAHNQRAIENALRCLRTISGDSYRIALTENWISLNLAEIGYVDASLKVLRESAPHYLLVYGCADSALASLPYADHEDSCSLIELGTELLPYTQGRGGEGVQLQLLKLASVLEEPTSIKKLLDAKRITSIDMTESLAEFLQDYKPSMLNRFLDSIMPSRQWEIAPKNQNHEVFLQWTKIRNADLYTARLLMKVAESRIWHQSPFPKYWVNYALTGVRIDSIGAYPELVLLGIAELSLQEKNIKHTIDLINETGKRIQRWPPQFESVYLVERNMAELIAKLPNNEALRKESRDRLVKRIEQLNQGIDPYGQMINLPLLAEACHQIGENALAQNTWAKAVTLCSLNPNPESQSIGLARIWISYGRANVVPEEEIANLLAQTEAQLPLAYSKIR